MERESHQYKQLLSTVAAWARRVDIQDVLLCRTGGFQNSQVMMMIFMLINRIS
jgi:hypothetical protein